MKNTELTAFAVALLCGAALAQTNWVDWRYGRPGVRVVTNAPSRAEHDAVSNLIAGISGVSVSTVGEMITNGVSGKVDITDGVSTNQTLFGASVDDKLYFNTNAAPTLGIGDIAWDSDWQTFKGRMPDGVTGQFFQESHIYGKNVSGQVITNGMVVRHSGAVGNSGKCEFTLAKAEVGVRPATTLGIATHDIAAGAFGKITWFGHVNELDTTGALYGETGWTNNMLVFVSTNKPGFLTKNEPQAPHPRISVGAVVNRHAEAGTIMVRPTWGMRVTEADDVDGTPLTASGQIMVWDNSRGVFDFTANINGYATTGALTAAVAGIPAEQDLAALRTYHYGSQNIVESPTNWFTIDGSGTITDYNFEAGRENVVIPWKIGGVIVTGIGTMAFSGTPADAITNVLAPRTLVYVGVNAFATCPELVSVSMPSVTVLDYGAFYYCLSATTLSVPSVTAIGEFAFANCSALQSLSFAGNAPSVGASAFESAHASLTVTATNPQATGWGATLSDGTREVPVVRTALRADAVYQGGMRVATTGDVAEAVAAIPVPDLSSRVAVSGGTATNLALHGWLALPQSAPTNLVLRLVCSNEHIYVEEVYP